MKKALVYFLVAIFLSGAAIVEALKLPLLVSHYIDHSNRNPEVGLVDFLSMHYWGRDIKDNDKDQDMRLPFKKTFHSHQQVLFCNSQNFHFPKTRHCLSDRSRFFCHREMINQSTTKLYRPPQDFLSVLG